MELWKATMKNTAEKGTFRAFGWLAGWGWAAPAEPCIGYSGLRLPLAR